MIPANADGKAVFDAVCATCHTVDPPATLAPPMSHVARHYRAELGDDEQSAVARIAQWVRTPTRERSLLPAHAIERWGVMPALALSGAQLDAVAAYVWSLGEEAGR
jgi:mono/diheme cytochrome c family protein